MTLLFMGYGCTPLFYKEVTKEIEPNLSPHNLFKDPEKYLGRVMILGGRIIKTHLREGKTWVEILEQPLDWRKKPKETDASCGRFFAIFADFRDPAIYSPSRKITVIGQVLGKKTLLINEREYPYPVLEVRDSYLWGKEAKGGLFFHFGIAIGGTF